MGNKWWYLDDSVWCTMKIHTCIWKRYSIVCDDSNLSNHKTMHLVDIILKEELHNRFNLISEERVKFFKHNSENLMKIGWKIRKLWHFEVSRIFKKHFLTSRYDMQMSELMMSSPHNFPFILYTEMTKISYFSYENVRLALILLWIDAE